jgi:hypothetical protein
VLLVSFVWFFDPKYLLSYVLGFTIVLFSLRKPVIAVVVDPWLKYFFWDHPNPYIKEKLKVKLLDHFNLDKAE